MNGSIQGQKARTGNIRARLHSWAFYYSMQEPATLRISDWDFAPVQGYRKWLHRPVLDHWIRAGLAYRQVGQP